MLAVQTAGASFPCGCLRPKREVDETPVIHLERRRLAGFYFQPINQP